MKNNQLKHLAIIADGNRRWAKRENKKGTYGYLKGLQILFHIADWCLKKEVQVLTYYGFSVENWNRPKEEVSFLLKMFEVYIKLAKNWYFKKGIKIRFIGRRDRLNSELVKQIELIEKLTAKNEKLLINICLDYSGKEEIIQAIQLGAKTVDEIDAFIYSSYPPPDIILRTGGEKRLSNFLMWSAGYAELFFVDEFFPDLSETILEQVLKEYYQRNRTYGE